ncbi:MAG: fused response regulator/phosphatase [Bryobacteraceae bacterium]|nr:fused response regulator/phosphatase [Bryobacteraceae bacterium]
MNGNEQGALSAPIKEYGIRVLLVDDQAMIGEVVRRMLAPEPDVAFEYCADPARAIPTADEWAPTVILQDLVMPDIDGLSLVRFYRAHPKLKDVPLIVLSTKEEAVTKAEAFALGANDYLVKLPDRIELMARIRYHSRGYINLLQRNEAYDALLKSQQELANEVARAAEYVESLLPKPIAEGALRTDWRYVPSTQLGGDSFGYHWIDRERFALYLLDVCGHGVGSALLSVSALNVLRSQALPGVDFRDPAAVLGGMNEKFQMAEHNNLYFTLWYGVYDAGGRRLRFSSGGHPPAFLLEGNGETRRLSTPNFFIGGFPKASYGAAETEVGAGSKLYVFSDGVYEVDKPDETMWTLDELEAYLNCAAGNGGGELASLYAHLQQIHGSDVLDDDFSLLRLEFA